ncbi:MAG: hypothetical protein E7813_01545 [Bradyrhizobium sp.]|uniref:outer membrane protein n=1 Tax=Bradyrhizobium sp. TaxID=376 RepID=UPI00121B32D6|nr:outer membrane beta-barrel protein [Bradyrhizobium sp.]THD75167.1 MAG: hypothetical protein E7813_01545 [Bradyrhizobium sp.]
MKKFLRGAFGLLALGMAAPAVAADFPVAYSREPVMIPAWYDWSGLYLGLNGGWASSRNCWNDLSLTIGGPSTGTEGCNNAKGALGGGQLGFRWQPNSSWVFGVEFQGDWADLIGSNLSQNPAEPGLINRSRVGAFGFFTGQIGYTIDTVLLYAKGGGALALDRYNGTLVGSPPISFDSIPGQVRYGAVAGAGLEFAFAPNWSLAFEYDHAFLGTRTEDFYSTLVAGVFTREDHIRQDMDIFTLRLNYRINGPVIAKY